MATLVALGRAVPVLQIADSRDNLLNNRMKTNTPLTALPHFLVNVRTVAPKFRNEMESRTHKSQTYRKPPCYEMWEAQRFNFVMYYLL